MTKENPGVSWSLSFAMEFHRVTAGKKAGRSVLQCGGTPTQPRANIQPFILGTLWRLASDQNAASTTAFV